MFSAETIKSLIEAALPGATVEVQDATGTRDHFQVTVVARQFDGKSLVEQHQLVYAPLREALAGDAGAIHALAVRTYTPAQWQRSLVTPGR
jgi:acid stress-induced BolA-like protein IbaG/YrbA